MKYLLIAVLVTALFSCNKELSGKIENRNGKYYLVNTSDRKAFQFTVKQTSSINDSIAGSETFVAKLAPGEERHINAEPEYKVDTVLINHVPTPEEILGQPSENKPDLKPAYKYSYQVTGQLELKNEAKYTVKGEK